MEKENLLKQLTKNEDGVLKSLNDLSLLGRNFFYCCVHLLLNSPEKSQNLNVFQKILPTFHYLSQNKNIDINRSNVLKILSNFANNGGSFIETREKIQIIKNEENQNHSFDKENGSNLDPEYKASLEYVKSQCGRHNLTQMAKILNLNRTTLYQRIKKKNIKIIEGENDNTNCKFCHSPSQSRVKITDQMMDSVRNACPDHKATEMATVLDVNSNTLQKRIKRSNIVFFNTDPNKCFFCLKSQKIEISDRQKRNKLEPIVDMIKRIAIQDEATEEYVISQIASKILYMSTSKRKVSQIFQKLGENPENFMAEFKYTIPTNLAIQTKIKLELSKSKYETLRDYLGEYINLPCYSTLASHIKTKMPTLEEPEEFKMNNEVVGKFWPPLRVAQDSIEETLEHHHGENPERVPQEQYLRGD